MKLLLTFVLILGTFSGHAQKDSLRIVSWNVFLRPGFLRDGQMERVAGIGHYLNNSNADVLVLQEVFHHRARRRLMHQLEEDYPYHTRIGKTSFFGVSSGVMIFSKVPIQKEKHVYFKRAIKADRLATKGGVLAEINFGGKNIDIVGTHLQAGGGEEGIEIRKEQIRRLKSLSETNEKPALFVGDFNIHNTTEAYTELVETLDCENFVPEGKIKHTANFTDHELTHAKGLPKWIDFILARRSGNVRIVSSHIEQPMYNTDVGAKRLSDHNPIFSVICPQ